MALQNLLSVRSSILCGWLAILAMTLNLSACGGGGDSQGATGAAGQNGSDGAAGPQGPSGQNGNDGAAGPPGPGGQNGNDGAAGPTGPTGLAGPPGTDAGAVVVKSADLPALNFSANLASLSIVAPPAPQYSELRLYTPPSAANLVGTFVGGGAGNKAMFQIPGFNGLPLRLLSTIEIDMKTLIGGPSFVPYFNFLVDLNCNANEDLNVVTLGNASTVGTLRNGRRIIVMQPVTAGPGVDVGLGYTRYTVTPSSAAWYIVGGAPSLGLALFPPGPLAPLSNMTSADYSAACLLDGVSGDGGLKRNTALGACVTGAGLPGTALGNCGQTHSAILLNLGDSNNLIETDSRVRRIKINETVITFE
jgi:Collagen triple helix repeat (20 copies)